MDISSKQNMSSRIFTQVQNTHFLFASNRLELRVTRSEASHTFRKIQIRNTLLWNMDCLIEM